MIYYMNRNSHKNLFKIWILLELIGGKVMFERRYPEVGEVFKNRGKYYKVVRLNDKRGGDVISLSEGNKLIKNYEWVFSVEILKDEALIRMTKYPIGTGVRDCRSYECFIIDDIGSYRNDHELRLIKCTWSDYEVVTTTIEEFLGRKLEKDKSAIEMYDRVTKRKKQEREVREMEDFKIKVREGEKRWERRVRDKNIAEYEFEYFGWRL